MPDKIVNHFVLDDGSTAKYDYNSLKNAPVGIAETIDPYSTGNHGVDIGNMPAIALNSDGTFKLVNTTAPFDVYVFPCAEGDAFIVNGTGGVSGNVRLWCFTKEITEGASTVAVTSRSTPTQSQAGLNNEVVYAPAQSAWAIFQFSDGGMVAKLGNGLTNYVSDRIEYIEPLAQNNNLTVGLINTHAGQYVTVENNAVKVDSAIVWKQVSMPCNEGDVFLVNGKGGSGDARLWGFLPDIAGETAVRFISICDSTSSAAGLNNEYITAPAGSKYVVFNMTAADSATNKVIKTSGLLSEVAKNSVIDKADLENIKNHLRFLVFGNSYGCDFISYVPFILKNMGITCEIYFYERDALSLRDLYNRWESTSETDTETDGIHAGTYYRNTFRIDTRTDTAWHTNTRLSAKQCVELGNFDFICMQQWSAYSVDATTYEPYLSLVIDLIRQSIDKPTPIVWTEVCTRPTHDDKEGALSAFENAVIKKHPFEFSIPYGTAIFNARTNNSLAAIGDYTNHNLWASDGVHLQDGLPRYIASLGAVEAICRHFFPSKSVLYDKTRPTTDLVSSWGVLQQHLPVVGITEENCFLAQKSAVMANLFPFTITTIESTPTAPTE